MVFADWVQAGCLGDSIVRGELQKRSLLPGSMFFEEAVGVDHGRSE